MPRFIASLLLTFTIFALHAASESDIRQKILFNKRANTAESATAMVDAIQECAAKIASSPKTPIGRRPFEVLISDAQEAITKMTAPEAQKVFAAGLGRLPVDGQVTLCYALRVQPANADVDAAATRLLNPGIDFRVRTALLDLLAEHHYAPAFDKMTSGLDPNGLPSVQIATCRALQALPDKRSIPALIKYMLSFPAGKGGRFIHEATGALRTLTGQAFAANPNDWKKWWEANQKNFAIDGSKSIEPDFNYELSEKRDLEYYEVPVVENRMVIVLDTSGSMSMGGKPNRLETAKNNLKEFIKALPANTLFNIIAFSKDVRRWRKDVPLLPANEANKKDAMKFVDEQKAMYGTQTALAMEEALREVAVINGCETIYLVTDGNPSPWANNVTVEQQERLITWMNQGLKIRINTIGIYTTTQQDEIMLAKAGEKEDIPKMKKFLYELASNNDGVYREVGVGGDTKVVKIDPKKEKANKEKEDKEKAAKADKDKPDKEDAASAKDKAPKDKDGKSKDPQTAEKKDKDADDKDKVHIDPPKSDKDIEIDVTIKKVDPAKKDAPLKPDDAKKDESKKDDAVKADESKNEPTEPKKPDPAKPKKPTDDE
jgi:hypothetical protein